MSNSSLIKTITKAFLMILLVFIIIIAFGFYYYSSELKRPLSVNEELFNIIIEDGTTKTGLINILNDKGLEIDMNIAKIYYRLNDTELEAGEYNLDLNSMNLETLLNSFNNGQFTQRVQFIEGWRLAEYIDYLEKNFGTEFAREFLESNYYQEGYMYPDTYIISKNWNGLQLAKLTNDTFEKRTKDLKELAESKDMNWDEVIILASILEREINITEDKPIVAGIYWKRLNTKGWRLQADATIQYAKGNSTDWWPIVTRDDYSDFNSVYNSYLNDNLPPTPISNPSYETINAIINYEESEYWYYISDNQGITRYAKNLEGHNKNIQVYLR